MLQVAPTMAAFISLGISSQDQAPSLSKDIDFLMRLETIDTDFKEVCRRLDIEPEPLPVRNKSTRQHYSVYYDDELIEMVAKKFYWEISFAGYQFGKDI